MREGDATWQNLVDAGCDHSFLETHMHLETQAAQTRHLRAYRKDLLAALHEAQRKLDCLDYLLFTLRQEDKKHGKGKTNGRT